MIDIATPQVGERWTTNFFKVREVKVEHKTLLSKGFSKWGQLNGSIVVITKAGDNIVPYHGYFEDLGKEVKFTYARTQLGRLVTTLAKSTIRKTCCEPSVRICAACKLESDNEQIAKGKVYNKVWRAWLKRED